MRDLIFGALLVVAAACIVIGFALVSVPSAWIAAGVLAAPLAWLLFGDVDVPKAPKGDT